MRTPRVVETQIIFKGDYEINEKRNKMAVTSPEDASLLLAMVCALRLAINIPGIVVLCLARRLHKSSDYSLKNDILLALIRR